jgi:Na+-driven multidrug efflux pump
VSTSTAVSPPLGRRAILAIALPVFAWFLAQGAKAGDVVLAANSILMQFIGVAAFFLDALAFAAETLVGQAVGAARREGLRAAARGTTEIAVALDCCAVLLFGIFALAWWLLGRFGNHGLWAAFYVHYAARTGTLLARYPRLVRSLPA